MNYLRQLDFQIQIQLIFLTIAVVLSIVSLIFKFLLKKRVVLLEDEIVRQKLTSKYRLVVKSSWMITILFWLIWLIGINAATLLMVLISFWLLREFITISKTQPGDHYGISVSFFVILPLQYYFAWSASWLMLMIFIPLIAFIVVPIINALSGEIDNFTARAAKLHMGLMVCVYGLSHIVALMKISLINDELSEFLPIFLAICVCSCLLIQYLFQQVIRVKPSLPTISQSFNWYCAFFAIIVGAVIGDLLSPLILPTSYTTTSMVFIACLAGVCGNLLLKVFKRSYGVVAWDKTYFGIPYSLLDKIGGLCFAAPVFFYSIMLYFGGFNISS